MCVKTIMAMNKLIYFSSLNFKSKLPRLISGHSFSNTPQRDIFNGVIDRYKGITVDLKSEKCDQQQFPQKLKESLIKWESDGNRCIWFKVNISDACCVPILAQKGFNFHHARDDFVMMYKWLPKDPEPNIPPASHTHLGVGAMVFNDNNKILAISEKNYGYPHWKLPGGYVERGEDIIHAAVREVKEETGIDAKFQSLVTFRHNHNMMFGNSDIYVILMMQAMSEKITFSEREIKSCQWMDIEQYCNHPHVHKFNAFVVRQALQHKKRNLRLDLEKHTVQWAQYVREMSFLVIKDYDDVIVENKTV